MARARKSKFKNMKNVLFKNNSEKHWSKNTRTGNRIHEKTTNANFSLQNKLQDGSLRPADTAPDNEVKTALQFSAGLWLG
jgi:hypothetical protein